MSSLSDLRSESDLRMEEEFPPLMKFSISSSSSSSSSLSSLSLWDSSRSCSNPFSMLSMSSEGGVWSTVIRMVMNKFKKMKFPMTKTRRKKRTEGRPNTDL